jgi:outer membrane protein
MKKIVVPILLVAILFFGSISNNNLLAQRVGFFSSQMIREKLPDAKLAEQRVQTMVNEWNRELKSMEDKEEALVFDMKKNRLIWSDAEKAAKDKELADLQAKRIKFTNEKYQPNVKSESEYDRVLREVLTPVEEKIGAAVQEVASKEKFDYIWDISTQPLAYANYKYDITLKVLKVLGVDVAAEEKEQEKKISADPRNEAEKKKESQTPRKRSRTTTEKQPQELKSSGERSVEDIKLQEGK